MCSTAGMTSAQASTTRPASGTVGSNPPGATATMPIVPAGGGSPPGPNGSSHQRAPGRCGSWATARAADDVRPAGFGVGEQAAQRVEIGTDQT